MITQKGKDHAAEILRIVEYAADRLNKMVTTLAFLEVVRPLTDSGIKD